MTLPWTIKYSPQTTQEIAGQDVQVITLKTFAKEWPRRKKRALILYGLPGCGKTSAVYALAKELNLEILEVNASDFRDEEKLEASVGQASKQRSLFGKSKILLVDEVEGVFSKFDQGAVPTLVRLIKETSFPIIFTANDPWDKKFSPLRTACELVEFKGLDHQTVLNVLRRICDAEKIAYEEKALSSLARRANGDLRGAIIDLQTLTENNSFRMEQLELLGSRHKTDTMFNALMKIFKTTDSFVARTSLEDVQEDLDETILWIDENLPKEYTKPQDIARAYEKIAHADLFRGRIRKNQYWYFLITISQLLSAGVALSKDQKYSAFVRYSPPQRLLKIWRSNMRFLKRVSIAEKIARKTHCSKKIALQETIPPLQVIFRKNKQAGEKIGKYLDLNDEESAWLSSG